LKSLRKAHLVSSGHVAYAVNEYTILHACVHPFINRCHGAFNATSHVHLLLDLIPGGELMARLQRDKRLDEHLAALYVAMVGTALGYLSSRQIAYRDLKPENLLIDHHGYLVLVDFGLAKVVDERTWTLCGTPDYLAPEVLAQAGYHWAVDWWALGALTYEMLHGEPPFAEEDEMECYDRIMMGMFYVGHHVSAPAKDLIKRLMALRPATRLGMLAGGVHDVVSHPFLAHIDVTQLLKKQLPIPTTPAVPPTPPPQTSGHGVSVELPADPTYDEIWEKEFGPLVPDA